MNEIAGFGVDDIRRRLHTAVVGDIMDTMGLTNQFLPPEIRPLDPTMIIVGSAMTVLESDIPPGTPPEQPFGVMFDALDDLHAGEVYVCSGSTGNYALWGELMSVRATHLGAAGVVLNGYTRDTNGILSMGFNTFAHGSYAQDQAPRGLVTDWRVPIQAGDVVVHPGDIIFGDIDGVCVIPTDAVDETITKAFDKVDTEDLVRDALAKGVTTVEAFERFGVM